MIINNQKTRMTNQRLKILDYLHSTKTHPTAECVYRNVKKQLPAITLATVYRNLNILADTGLIIKLEINNEMHFDAEERMHQHMICENCGKIIDVFDTNMSMKCLKKMSSEEFSIKSVNIIFKGYCKNCMEVK